MAFLDNSGDIILDAVLTDAGRKRLAAGDGSFKISKFAFGDDEVDYSLYTPVTSSGYEDLRILQLPVFEAFTNNTSVMKNKLLTYADNSLLYLPVIKLNNILGGQTTAAGGYNVAVDVTTRDAIFSNTNTAFTAGSYRAAQDGAITDDARIIFDQGLDTTELTLAKLEDTNRSLMETQYIIEVDNRLLQLATGDGSLATPTFIDDDNVASYYFSMNSSDDYYFPTFDIEQDPLRSPGTVIGSGTTGRIGSRLRFDLRSTLDLQVNTTLFTQLGSTGTTNPGDGNINVRMIDTVVRVTGFTTGYRTDVALKLLKKI
jgi:hypothetical protein